MNHWTVLWFEEVIERGHENVIRRKEMGALIG